jgi:hypothetical protein
MINNVACNTADMFSYCCLLTAFLRNIYGRYFNIKETGEARGGVMMIR